MLTGEVPFQADTQVAVAMKHVQEPMPDVQRRRPEISAALAAVVERSTAKELRNRYATVDDDGRTTSSRCWASRPRARARRRGEATTVLRTLPGDTSDFVPGRMRHPRRAVFASVFVIAVIAGVIAWFATHTEKGAGPSVAPKTPGLADVNLAAGAASDYDPEGDDGEESPEQARNVVDGNRTTNWDTETYQGGFAGSHKGGVGIYVDTGARASPPASSTLVTSTPGFRAARLRLGHRAGVDPRVEARRARSRRSRRTSASSSTPPARSSGTTCSGSPSCRREQGERARAEPLKRSEAVACASRLVPLDREAHAACRAARGTARRSPRRASRTRSSR